MSNLKASLSNTGKRHVTQSWQEGEWIIFSCPECGQLRKTHWPSGQMQLVEPGDQTALHTGVHNPVVWDEAEVFSSLS